MVGIEQYTIFFYFFHQHRKGLPFSVVHHQLHTRFSLHIGWKLLLGKFNDHFLIFFAIGIAYFNFHCSFIANLHAHHPLVKTFYYLAATHSKLKWVSALRAIKCFSVAQFSMIMHFYFVPAFYLLHD